jgi:hypothetical protein
MYAMPINAIKRILMNEYEGKRAELYRVMREGWFLKEYFGRTVNTIKDEIDMIDSYDAAEIFIGNHYQMSLDDWINTL